MQKILVIASFLLFVFGCSCKCDISEEILRETAAEKYGSNADISFNEENTFALVVDINKPTPHNPNKSINFFVFDLNNNKIVYEKDSYNGSVAWINNSQVEMCSIPGIVQYDQNQSGNVIIYDLILQEEFRK